MSTTEPVLRRRSFRPGVWGFIIGISVLRVGLMWGLLLCFIHFENAGLPVSKQLEHIIHNLYPEAKLLDFYVPQYSSWWPVLWVLGSLWIAVDALLAATALAIILERLRPGTLTLTAIVPAVPPYAEPSDGVWPPPPAR